VEIDLVGHEGGNSAGEFCFTLTVTDIATGWTINRSVKNKAAIWVCEPTDHVGAVQAAPDLSRELCLDIDATIVIAHSEKKGRPHLRGSTRSAFTHCSASWIAPRSPRAKGSPASCATAEPDPTPRPTTSLS
jgi:hypothetical protein